MDYAAALWGMTLEQFERDVVRPRLASEDSRGLREFIVDELLEGSEDVDEAADQLLDSLSETLRSGEFALVVAAPVIPEGVQRVMEYLNARALTVYGLEVSYFAGEVEAFVPRIVVRPTVGTRIAGRDSQAETRTPIDSETFFDELPESASDLVRRFVNDVPLIGGELQWRHYGPRVRVRGSAGPKVVASIQADGAYVVVGKLQGIDPEPAARAAARLQAVPNVSRVATYPGVTFQKASREDLEAFFGIARDFVRDLADTRAT
jgi:hypothetical protein